MYGHPGAVRTQRLDGHTFQSLLILTFLNRWISVKTSQAWGLSESWCAFSDYVDHWLPNP